MDIRIFNRKFVIRVYYLPSIAMLLLALTYCTMVYLSGEIGDFNAGYKYLIGIPNYYFFYICIFPFVTTGIMYIATQNINIRFFGPINEALSKVQADKIRFHRKLLLIVAIIFSLAVTINDASEKGRTLPPYSLSLASDQIYVEAMHKYFELKALENKRREKLYANNNFNYLLSNNQDNADSALPGDIQNLERDFLEFIKQKGYQGKSSTGFQSFSSWYHNSSFIYKFESFLSWAAAFVISVFFAQFFLIIMIKNHILSETKNLALWLLILCSFWIPCKIFSVYYYSLKPYQPPAIVWFAIFLLAISIVLALFMKVEKNDITKYATVLVAVFSFAATSVSIFRPYYFELAIDIMQQLGWMYGGILLLIMAFSIYLVTEHLIDTYEKSKDTVPGSATISNHTSHSN